MERIMSHVWRHVCDMFQTFLLFELIIFLTFVLSPFLRSFSTTNACFPHFLFNVLVNNKTNKVKEICHTRNVFSHTRNKLANKPHASTKKNMDYQNTQLSILQQVDNVLVYKEAEITLKKSCWIKSKRYFWYGKSPILLNTLRKPQNTIETCPKVLINFRT